LISGKVQQLLRSKIGLGISLFVLVLGCRAATPVPEPGAVLLRLTAASGAPAPDELRVWVYDDGGALWSDVRVPGDGPLVAESAGQLGTIFIQPGNASGALRIHVRGLAGGARVSDGLLVIAPGARAQGTFDLALGAAVPADADGDDVPDLIDDCPSVADPDQTGCVDAGATADSGTGDATDAAVDGQADPDAADAASAVVDAGLDCDATGACNRPQGATCSTADECASGYCVDGVCCGNACEGPCRSCNQPNLNGTCQGYAPGTDPEYECPAGTTCNGVGACGPQSAPANKANGSLCAAGTECGSGFCVDGVCCNSACSSPCQTCGTGTCTSVTRAPDPPQCVSPKTCNAAGKCVSS
jgi:hypothetical protein